VNKELAGIICQWNDQKGFGFIKGHDGSSVFFHITSLRGDCRPQVNDKVFYIPKKDEQARISAAHVRHFELKVDNPKIRVKHSVVSPTKNPYVPQRSLPLTKSKEKGTQSSGRIRSLRLKLLLFILLLVLPMLGAVRVFIDQQFIWVFVIYILVSLITFYLYWNDKKIAGTNQRRTPEITLHFFEFIGGWIGALVAQQMFRHKTRKISYQLKFWIIIFSHQFFWFDRIIFEGYYAHCYFGVWV